MKRLYGCLQAFILPVVMVLPSHIDKVSARKKTYSLVMEELRAGYHHTNGLCISTTNLVLPLSDSYEQLTGQ